MWFVESIAMHINTANNIYIYIFHFFNRRLPQTKMSSNTTTSKDDHNNDDIILIGGKSIHKANLKTIQKMNKLVDNETEEKKKLRLRRETISNRENETFTTFGTGVGCEIDEMGVFLERSDEDTRKDLWIKIMPNSKQTDKQTDIRRIVMAVTYSVIKKKAIAKANGNVNAKVNKPDPTQIERLVTEIRRKFPRDKNKKVLRKTDFVKKFHLWLYEIHDDPNWRAPSA